MGVFVLWFGFKAVQFNIPLEKNTLTGYTGLPASPHLTLAFIPGFLSLLVKENDPRIETSLMSAYTVTVHAQ